MNLSLIHRSFEPYRKLVNRINENRAGLLGVPDQQLLMLSRQYREQVQGGVPLDDVLAETYGLACEAARRILGLRPFDVQIVAGIAMHRGILAQMQTGEGKTLAAVLPVYLNALEGRGVHVLTFNDYLARRDARWMGPIYRFLGLTVGHVQEGMSIPERQQAYAADVTYVTAKEAGFDFLRDQRCFGTGDLVHREFRFALVDEADSILIDEARIPLVIAGEVSPVEIDFYGLAELVRRLKPGTDYYKDEYSRDVNFTDVGLGRVESHLGRGDLHRDENNQVYSAANLALQAESLLHRDIDYIIRDGKIQLVDEFTGRVADKRRWPYGLQTAIEAKEGVVLQPEGMILGSITFQHFMKLYPKAAGMTATAKTSAEEFTTFYEMPVLEIPPNRPCIRTDHEDMVFTHKVAKMRALVREIRQVHATGRPILVGTRSVEESEELAQELRKERVACQMLNAKNDEAEAAIIADAGALKAVTISTNMAGRGTDIRLGGKEQADRDTVVALGGLYVIGTNRHENRRIDMQLRGRAGRQGDPGSSRFFVSLEDDLMVRYRVNELIPPKQLPKKEQWDAIGNPIVAREIARAQRIIEGQNLEIRKTLRNYSFIVEEQRKIIQDQRKDVLTGAQPPGRLAELSPERYNRLLPEVGEAVLADVEKKLTLFFIDKYWTDHLAYIAHIREGIHLYGFAGKIPSFEFQKMAIEGFDRTIEQVDESISLAFERAAITAGGIDMEKEGLSGPSSTWTYLINDIPFSNPLQSALLGSMAFNFGAALAILLHLPIVLLGGFFRRIDNKRKRKKKETG